MDPLIARKLGAASSVAPSEATHAASAASE
jgi:hypothetical protein